LRLLEKLRSRVPELKVTYTAAFTPQVLDTKCFTEEISSQFVVLNDAYCSIF